MRLLAVVVVLALAQLSWVQRSKPQVGVARDGQFDIARQMVRAALTDTLGYHLLRELSALGPRLVGSEQSMRAIRWAERTMQELGLENVHLQEVTVPHWQRGDVEEAKVVWPKALQEKRLRVAALGGSAPTPPGGIRAPVLELHSLEQVLTQQGQVRGKIAFFNRPMEAELVDTFAAYGRAVDQRVQGPAEAGLAGAVAVIVRSVTTKADNMPHVGALRYRDQAPQPPAVAVGVQDAERLAEWLRAHGQVEIELRLSCRDLGRTLSYNVIGDLRGRDRPEEVVLVGGHFDSWDQGQGCHDDAAGCIQALEVLQLLKRLGIQPRRTVRVVFFINEEFGLDGARAYADHAAASSEYHLAAIESDRGAFTPRGFYVDAADSVVTRIQEWLPLLNLALIEWVRKRGGGADIAQLKGAKALIGYVPDAQRYFDYHHSGNDVFAAVHPREFELGVAAMAILTYLIAEEGL